MSQMMEALAVATTLRLDRAAIRREIERLDSREARNRVAEIIRDPDELWGRVKGDEDRLWSGLEDYYRSWIAPAPDEESS